MGIDITSWRCRIGNFNGGRSRLNCHPLKHEDILLVKFIPLLLHVLAILLLIGGVERNPGPLTTNVQRSLKNGKVITEEPKNCLWCDKQGRKNAVKIYCADCKQMFHKTCFIKRHIWTDKELRIFCNKTSYMCWACSLPAFNDSLWSCTDEILSLPPKVIQNNSKKTRKNDSEGVSILCFNARSLKNRKTAASIASLFEIHSADICAVNETWLNEEVRNHEFIPREYVVFRKDRIKGRGGGVLLAIRPFLQPKRLMNLEGAAEIVWVEIRVGKLKLIVGSAYRRPNACVDENTALLQSLDLVANEQLNYDGCILMGDLNLQIMWNCDPPEAIDSTAKEFKSAFADMAFHQLVNGPTRTTDFTEKTIDLLLCDVPALVSYVKVVAGVSDHDAILACLSLPVVRPKSAPRDVFNFQRADWPSLNEALSDQLEMVLHYDEVNEAWEAWKRIVFECVDKYVPKKRVGGGKKSGLLPWIDKNMKRLMRIRDNLFDTWFKSKSNVDREAYLVARRTTQAALRNAKDNYMWLMGRGAEGSTNLWRYIKSKATVPNNAASFDVGRTTVSDPKDVAARFSEVFQNNFSRPENVISSPSDDCSVNVTGEQPTLSELVCLPAEVHKMLLSIKVSTATGPDGVPAVLLKNAATSLCVSLTHIFNKSLDQGVPVDWKIAAVGPIYKDGDKRNMGNYRPVSNESMVAKMLERFVRDKTSNFLEDHSVIPSTQHGFRRGRSCTTMLAGAIDSWTSMLDKFSGTHIHVIFLDWSKAFDKVPHARLLSKLQNYGIRGKLLQWYKSFLVGRTQYVKFNEEVSEQTEVPSGVIQGSVLGPLLFNIYVSDLPKSEKVEVLQYADDVTMFRVVATDEDVDDFQNALNDMQIWCEINGMSLNPLKCKVMDITRARMSLEYKYFIGDDELKYVEQQRLLGIQITSDLRWSVHTDVVRAKAAQILSFVSRNLQGCTPRIKRIAYLSLVKPIMTFGLPAWHPSTVENKLKLERVQKKALHFIYGRRLPPITKQHIMPLAMHLNYADLLFFKKCVSGATDYDAMARITEGRMLRGDDNLNPPLQPPETRSEFGRRAFSYRVVHQWNDLPLILKNCNVRQFPSLCKDYLWHFYS